MVSPIWNHFTNDKSVEKATCKYCSALLHTKKSNTSNLWRHVQAKHPHIPLKTPDSSTTSDDKLPLFSNVVDVTGDKMASLLRAFDRSDEITQLKEQLLEKDKEIERLKKTMLEMSDSHVRRMDAVMDMVKRALREEVAADVVNALQLH